MLKIDNLSVLPACPYRSLEMAKPICPLGRLIFRHLPLGLTFQTAKTDK